MADLVINPSGTYTNYFIVSLDGGAYALPQLGADLTLRLRGRVPSRYEPGGMDASLDQGPDEEGGLVMQRFCSWDERVGAGGVMQFEGFIQRPDAALHAHGVLAFGSLAMPAGVIAVLGYEGLSPENRRMLMAMPSPPLGTLRMC